jgi:hypothetical protein
MPLWIFEASLSHHTAPSIVRTDHELQRCSGSWCSLLYIEQVIPFPPVSIVIHLFWPSLPEQSAVQNPR